MVALLIVLLILFLIYLYLIMPRMLHRPDTSVLFGWQYAHRGLHDNQSEAPENSLKAFQKAVENGYGIELDVQLTKDEQVVVFHDPNLKRICGIDAPVNSMTYEELQQLSLLNTNEKIPLFSEVLQVVDSKVPLIVEIKMVDFKTRVCELTNDLLKNYHGVYCIESFHPFAVRWYQEHRPDVIRGQLSADFYKENEKEDWQMFAVHHLVTNVICRPDFIAYSNKAAGAVGRNICRYLFRGLSVAWTIRSAEELDAAKDKYDLFIFEGFLADKKQ